MRISLPRISMDMVTVAWLVALSLLMAVYVPMTTANAQAVAESNQLKDKKDKAAQEIDRRIKKFEDRLKKLEVDVQIKKENSSAKVSGQNGSASVEVDEDGIHKNVEVSDELKDRVISFLEKIIEGLKGLKEKVLGATSLEQMNTMGENIDDQFQLTQLADAQGAVTKAVESMTGVLDKLKATFSGLKSQVGKMRECAAGLKSGEGTANINVQNQNLTADASAPGCDDFNLNGEEVVADAESQLANITTIISTISSVLLSSVTLLVSLVSSFSSLTGGLGSLGSLGNLANLGNIGDLGGMLGSAGNIGGLMSSFSAITSQLGIANGMAGNSQNLLGSLTSFINI